MNTESLPYTDYETPDRKIEYVIWSNVHMDFLQACLAKRAAVHIQAEPNNPHDSEAIGLWLSLETNRIGGLSANIDWQIGYIRQTAHHTPQAEHSVRKHKLFLSLTRFPDHPRHALFGHLTADGFFHYTDQWADEDQWLADNQQVAV